MTTPTPITCDAPHLPGRVNHLLGVPGQLGLLVVVTTLAYAGSFRGSWQFDDQHVIRANPAVRDLGAAFGQIGSSTRSLVHWTFALNYSLGRLDPWGYHLVNLIVHVGAAVCLFGWLRSVPAGREPAWAAALLFAVHPLTTQSVTYITQRYSSMAGLFFFASLWAWSRYRHGRAKRAYFISLAACLAAMLCKEMAVALPLALVAADFALHSEQLPKRKAALQRCREYFPLALLFAVVPVLNFGGRELSVAEFSASLNWAAGTELTRWSYFLSQWRVLVFTYLRLMFLPSGLSIQHSSELIHSPADAPTLLAGAVLVVLLAGSAALAFAGRQARTRLAGYGGLLFFLGLGATSSFVPNSELVQEQRTYVSLAGIVLMVCTGLWPLRSRRPAVRIAIVGGLAATLAWLTFERNKVWHSPVALWRDAIAKAPDSPRAHNNLGLALAEIDRTDEAIEQYRRALELNPRYAFVLNNLGIIMYEQGRMADAAALYVRVVRLAPEYAEGHNNLGATYEQLGRLDEAISQCREALRLRPDYADAHNSLANALSAAGQRPAALSHYHAAIDVYQRLDETDRLARVYNNLANALSILGRHEEALPFYRDALKLSPNYVKARVNLAHVLRAMNHLEDAVAMYRRVVEQGAADARVLEGLGDALLRLGQRDEAERAFRSALQVDPLSAAALRGLRALEQAGQPGP